MPALVGTIKNKNMAKVKATAVEQPKTIEEALAVIAEKDAEISALADALDESNKVIAESESKIASLEASVADKTATLTGVDTFTVNGKTLTPKKTAIKSGGKITYFAKSVANKFSDVKDENKVYFGDLTEEAKASFVEQNPQLFI